MDPKQTEGQGSATPASQGGFSFSSGQPGSGQPPAAQPGTLSTGANVSRTMDDLNVNDRKSATSNSPFAKHQFNKIAPGTGDIIIGQPNGTISSAPGDKEPKINRGRLIQFGLIFGGIALVALVIFTVVMVVNNNQSKTPSNGANQTTPTVTASVEELFSEYLELFTSNNEDKKDITTNWKEYLSNYASIYAVRQALQPSSTEKDNYFEALNQKWDEFISNYKGQYSNSPELQYVPIYFYYMATSSELTERQIYELYNGYSQNLDETKKAVEDMTTNPTSNYALFVFYQTKRDLYISTLNLMSEAKSASCLTPESLFASCDLPTLTSYAAYQNAQNQYAANIPELLSVYKYGALSMIQNLCEELFGEADTLTTGGAQ